MVMNVPNEAHVGYNCPAQVPSVQTLPSFPQQYPCCDDSGVTHEPYQYDNIIFGLPPFFAITPDEPVLSTKEPDNSLSMGDEHLDTILAMKLDEFIKSGVKNLIPIPSESEGVPDHRCDVPSHDNSPPLDILEDQFEDFSESNEEFSSTDDDSFSFDKIDYVEASPPNSELVSSKVMEIVIPESDFFLEVDAFLTVEDEPTSSQFPKSYLDPEGDMLLFEAFLNDDHSFDFKTKSSSTSLNSLLEETNNFNISLPEFTTFSKVLFDAEYEFDSSDDQSYEFVGELALLKSIPRGIEETDCDFEEDIRLIEKLLYDNSSPRPPKEFVSANSDAKIKSFSPSPVLVKDSDLLMEEIDLFYTLDYPMPPGIDDKDYASERDIIIPKDFPRNNTLSFAEKDSFHFDIPSFSRPPAKHQMDLNGEDVDVHTYSEKREEKRIEEEQATKAQNSKILACCDDDDDYNSAITPNEPIDSLGMGDEHLDTGENGCDVPACFTTFLNVLFDVEYEFDSSDNQSLSDENFSNPLFEEEIISMKIDPHRFNAKSDLIESLLNHDSFIIPPSSKIDSLLDEFAESMLNQDSSIISSSKIDSLLDEFTGELILLKSIPLGIDEVDYDPVEEIHLIEKLLYDNSSPNLFLKILMLQSNLSLHPLSPLRTVTLFGMRSIYLLLRMTRCRRALKRMTMTLKGIYVSLKNFLAIIPFHFLQNESFHFDIPSSPRPHAKPPDGDEIEPNSGILTVKAVGDISEHSVPIPRLFPTQPTHASNLEKSPHLLSHQDFKSFLAFF
nr:hypothetical protein [Tanacetum cinerariifolium]